MKRIIPVILIFVLLIGCGESKIINNNDIKKSKFNKEETELLNDMGINGLRYDVNVKKLDEEDWANVFIDRYENGKFVETEMQLSLSGFLEEETKLIWGRMSDMENKNEIWKLRFSSGYTTKNIEFAEEILSYSTFEIEDSRDIKKDSEIYLAGLSGTSNENQGFRTGISNSKGELEDYIKDFDITYILGIRIK